MGKAINKVILGETTLMDISEDTVSEDNLLEGATAHAADGTQITGKVVVAEIVDNLEDKSPDKALSANQGKVLKDYIYKHPYVSYDNKNPTEYDDQVLITKGQPLQNLLSYLTTAVKNIRYLFKMIGSTDISAIGDGTLTGGLSTLNSNLIKTKEIAIDVTVAESGYVLGSYYGYFQITIPSEIINTKIIAFIPISATSITLNGSCGILGLYSADFFSNNFIWTVSTPTSGTYRCRFIIIFI